MSQPSSRGAGILPAPFWMNTQTLAAQLFSFKDLFWGCIGCFVGTFGQVEHRQPFAVIIADSCRADGLRAFGEHLKLRNNLESYVTAETIELFISDAILVLVSNQCQHFAYP